MPAVTITPIKLPGIRQFSSSELANNPPWTHLDALDMFVSTGSSINPSILTNGDRRIGKQYAWTNILNNTDYFRVPNNGNTIIILGNPGLLNSRVTIETAYQPEGLNLPELQYTLAFGRSIMLSNLQPKIFNYSATPTDPGVVIIRKTRYLSAMALEL